MAAPLQPHDNRLLAALPAADLKRILPHLELVELPLGAILYQNGGARKYAYFPADCIVSLLHVMGDGTTAEIAMVGYDGVIGTDLYVGGASMLSRAVMQRAGSAWRISGETLSNEFRRGGTMQRLLLRYSQALMTQMAQSAGCYRHHTISQQFCRWLLMSLDLARTNEIQMTQEAIANMLGVRREGVTAAAGRLQSSGTIQYSRGHIKVTNRANLKRCACECYDVVKAEYDRLLNGGNKD